MSSFGTFVWYDLMTTDPASARAFYLAVVGNWTLTPFGDTDYKMWTVDGTPIGGVNQLPDDVEARPHWVGYVHVPNVDDGLARVVELGGRSLMRENMEGVGIIGVFTDPQGGVLSMFQPDGDATADPAGPGYIGWHELASSDLDAAWTFYSQLFGWVVTTSMDMGPGGTYQMYGQAGASPGSSLGGMYNKSDMPATTWCYYISVDDLDAALDRVKGHGGTVINGPMDVPGGDRVAQCTDPQGGVFALHESGPAT
jgi:predicted enzyme related to lactoylglutathione lyase